MLDSRDSSAFGMLAHWTLVAVRLVPVTSGILLQHVVYSGESL